MAAMTAATLGMAAGAANADHAHHLVTPGTCVYGIGEGQPHAPGHTWQPGQGKFVHSGLHVGTPGTFAFTQPANPVDFAGGVCP